MGPQGRSSRPVAQGGVGSGDDNTLPAKELFPSLICCTSIDTCHGESYNFANIFFDYFLCDSSTKNNYTIYCPNQNVLESARRLSQLGLRDNRSKPGVSQENCDVC